MALEGNLEDLLVAEMEECFSGVGGAVSAAEGAVRIRYHSRAPTGST